MLEVDNVDQLPCFALMPALKQLSLKIHRRHASVAFPEAMPRLLPALQVLNVAGEGWGGLVVGLPDTVATLHVRMVRLSSRVYHHSTPCTGQGCCVAGV